MGQLKSVGGGFWISVTFPNTLIETLSVTFRGIMDNGVHLNTETIVPTIFAIILYLYIGFIIYKEIKQKNDIKVGIISLLLYLSIILVATCISNFMPILYYRYLFVITSFLIFSIAFFLSKEKNVIITTIILLVISLMAIINQYKICENCYNEKNMKQVCYLNDNIEKEDIFIYSEIYYSSLVPYFKGNKQYFLNLENWGVEEAYKAYAPTMETKANFDFLENYIGRIWVMDTENKKVYNLLKEKYKDIDIINDMSTIETKYHEYKYHMVLIQKNS